MPRQPRLLIQEGLYHVISRGNAKLKIFRQDDDFYYFEKKIKLLRNEYGFILSCYCIMQNHFHLLIKTNKNACLSRIMQSLLTSYAMRFNHKYNRVGIVFQNRFKSFLVSHDPYLITLIDYIHQNPVRIGFVEKASDYKFSSAKAYESDMPDGFVDIDFLEGLLAKHYGLSRTILT